MYFYMGCGVGGEYKNAIFEDIFPYIIKIPSIAEFGLTKVNQL